MAVVGGSDDNLEVAVVIHVQPGAAKTEVAGRYGDALRVRVQAPAADHKATDAAAALIAEVLGVPRRQVTVESGFTSRRKRLRARGVSRLAVARVEEAAR